MSNDRFTDVSIEFSLKNQDAQENSNFSSGTSQNSAAIFTQAYGNNRGAIFAEAVTFPNYLSKEFNYNILDGSMPVASFEQNTQYSSSLPYVSKAKSGSNGVYSVEPGLTVTFDEVQSAVGIVLYFIGSYPKTVEISWYLEDNMITSLETELSSSVSFIIRGVREFDKLTVSFKKNFIPDRFVKMYFFEFGSDLGWKENEIKSGKIVQEVNLLADKLSLNSLDFEVIDTDNNFNYGNPYNILDFFKRLSPVNPVVNVDGELINFGKYYLDKIKVDTNLVKFSCFSAIGILDNTPFNDGSIYNGIQTGTLLAELFEISGITSYQISDGISTKPLYGTIKPCTCREALQKILFAVNGVVRTNSNDYQIIVEEASTALGHTVTRAEKISTKVTDFEYVTGVELSFTTYQLNNTVKTLVEEAVYSDGEHTIIFNQPCTDVEVVLADGSSPVTVLKTSTYYIKFKTTEGYVATLSIVGKVYEEKSTTLTAFRTNLKEGSVENVKRYSTTLCDYARADALVNNLLIYYIQSTLNIQIKQFSKDTLMTGRQVIQNEIEGLGNYVGRYTSRVFDLTGGFIDDAKLIGYYEAEAESEYFSDAFDSSVTDIYSGDDILV